MDTNRLTAAASEGSFATNPPGSCSWLASSSVCSIGGDAVLTLVVTACTELLRRGLWALLQSRQRAGGCEEWRRRPAQLWAPKWSAWVATRVWRHASDLQRGDLRSGADLFKAGAWGTVRRLFSTRLLELSEWTVRQCLRESGEGWTPMQSRGACPSYESSDAELLLCHVLVHNL